MHRERLEEENPPPGGGGQWLNAEERGAKYFSKNQNEENY